jgi:hypothetical protein
MAAMITLGDMGLIVHAANKEEKTIRLTEYMNGSKECLTYALDDGLLLSSQD